MSDPDAVKVRPIPAEAHPPWARIAVRVLLLVFFAGLFFRLTTPIADPDFWWHLASGRWMWQHGSLMSSDPFTFPVDPHESPARVRFALTQYWLSQILFFGAWSLGGFKGVILLRAAVFTLLFLLLFRLMRGGGAGVLLSSVMTALAVAVIAGELVYIGDRPQMWSSLFSVVTLALLESMRLGKRWAYPALPVLLLVWANLHGGYTIGVMLVGAALLLAALGRLRDGRFYLCAAAAVAVSGLNPNGYSAFPTALPLFLGSSGLGGYSQSIVELQSIFSHARLSSLPRLMPNLTLVFVLSLASYLASLYRWRALRKDLLVVYLIFLGLGTVAIRFLVFFVCVAALAAALNVQLLADSLSGRWKSPRVLRASLPGAAACLALLAGSWLFWAGAGRSGLLLRVPYDASQDGLISFIREKGLQGNLFNDYQAGGYLAWALPPGVKTFIDGRTLYPSLFGIYQETVDTPFGPGGRPGKSPAVYRKVLDDFEVDHVALPGCDSMTGTLIPLTVTMARDPDWAVIFADENAVLFSRAAPRDGRPGPYSVLPRQVVYDNIIALARRASAAPHGMRLPDWRYAMAYALFSKGDLENAVRYLDGYLRLAPGDTQAAQVRRELEALRRGPLPSVAPGPAGGP